MTEEQNNPVETETAPPKRKIGRPFVKNKVQQLGVRLPPWLIAKIRERKGSCAKIIQHALCKTYGWEAPKDL